MSRMGADGYSSSNTTRLSAKVPDGLKRDFRDACDSAGVTMTEAVEEFMAEFVAENGPAHVSSDSEVYYPDHATECSLYEACWEASEHSDLGPRIYQRRHASTIAQQTQHVSKNELGDALMPLRQGGYVAQVQTAPYLPSEAADRWRSWLVKPPCADPVQWKYREDKL